ncbi:hypothetical protein GOV07_04200 [Candidatus Woesearchaeota archaeon]|nr:hypothetical protein [Candidatus Woesearchaeota archaeon]
MRTVSVKRFSAPLFAFFFIIFLSTIIQGTTDTSRPTTFADSDAIATIEASAYDNDNTTFANITGGGSGNLTFSSFVENGDAPWIDVKQVDILFDIDVNGLSDDQWALEYTNDSGASWYTLRALAGGNSSRSVFTYLDVAGPGGDWNWSGIGSRLGIRLRYVVVGGADSGTDIRLYEAWANVTTDKEGPIVILVAPSSGTNYSGLTLVDFSYNVSDALSGLTNCTLFLDGVPNATNTTPSESGTNNISATLDDGEYEWGLACFDNASTPNRGVSQIRTLIIDNAPPSLIPLSPSGGTQLNGSQTITFLYSYSDRSALSNCTLFLNGTENITMMGGDVNWPSGEGQFVVSVVDGLWEWNVTCTDIYDRTNMSAAATFTQAANDAPVFDAITIPSSTNIMLGGNVIVWCNATITDLQGASTITMVESYFHRADWDYSDADTPSSHHTGNCSSTPVDADTVDYACNFTLPYYARSMNWTCTYRVVDELGYESFGINNSFVEPLYAFNLTPQFIAYGLINPGNISGERSVTVTNLGNAELDMALDGYAQVNGDGLALVCDVGNTSIEDERYAISSGLSWSVMTQLSDVAIQADEFNLPPRNESFDGEKDIYWRVRLGVPQKGNCTGFVTFTGVQS